MGALFALACNAACSFATVAGGARLLANLRAVAASGVGLELRPLPSTGVVRLRRYYGPLRRPRRPGLSLAGVRLTVTRCRRWGFPCCVGSPCVCMPSPLPRWDRWLRRSFVWPSDSGLPRNSGGSAPTSPFSRPARRSLAFWPAHWPSRPEETLFTRGFDGFVTSSVAPIATGWNDQLPGGSRTR